MKALGDIALGRPNLGQSMPVMVYRLFEMAIMDVLTERFGQDASDEIIREAGFRAGMVFAKGNLDKTVGFSDFISALQDKLSELKIGILRIENADLEKGEVTLSVYEDLDCSGLPVTDEQICVYDEGFIAAILEYYSDKPFNVREVDCWASGERVCRFKAKSK